MDDKKDIVIKKALDLLKKKYGLDKKIPEEFFEIFRKSSKPSIKPYHIESPSLRVYEYIVKNKLEVFIEKKYDGTHMQISEKGIFKHDGKPASIDQLAYFLFYCINNGGVFEETLKAIRKGYTIEFELFGRDYTPMGFHKTHHKPIDIVVFELGYEDKWIPPPDKYNILEELKLPYVNCYKINYKDMEDLIKRVNDLASMQDTYEGVVVKSKFLGSSELPVEYVKTSTLLIFKVKKEVIKEKKRMEVRRESLKEYVKVDLETLAIIKSEVRNEVGKIKGELGEDYLKDKKNFPYVISRIEKYLKNGHPQLYNDIVKFLGERGLRKVIAEELILFQEKKIGGLY